MEAVLAYILRADFIIFIIAIIILVLLFTYNRYKKRKEKRAIGFPCTFLIRFKA